MVEIDSGQDFRIGAIDFHPFTVPHDAADNFGFTATHNGVKVATLMDFGHVTTLIAQQLRGCAAIVIESNHSRDMLKTVENYPWELKQRILSRLGHLSNEDVAEWLVDGFDGQASHIVLAHMSQRANNPYLAKSPRTQPCMNGRRCSEPTPKSFYLFRKSPLLGSKSKLGQ